MVAYKNINIDRALRRCLFRLSSMNRRGFILKFYKEFQESQWWPIDKRRASQLKQLKYIVRYAYRFVPYYKELFDSCGIHSSQIRSHEDLAKIPILTKKDIRENRTKLRPNIVEAYPSIEGSTGGSTGQPLHYPMALEDYARGVALLYRGWGFAGYELGNRIAIIAGSSLIPNVQSSIKMWLVERLRNIYCFSSYGMSEARLHHFVQRLKSLKPRFLRGYASSLFILAEYINKSGDLLNFSPDGVFTTAEKLLESQRNVIEQAFDTEVYDNYGLNDGGVSAFECNNHYGMHIDMERSVLEVVDDKGVSVINKPGRIIATSLYNYAMPFIRYDTGDIGIVKSAKCPCGRESPILANIIGRSTDVLVLNGKKIGGPIFTVLLGKFDINEYQVVQKANNLLVIRIVKGREYSAKDEAFIRKSIEKHVGKLHIQLEYVSAFIRVSGDKHKFIVNEDV